MLKLLIVVSFSLWIEVKNLKCLFSVFNSSRGHAIERENYLDDLQHGPKRRWYRHRHVYCKYSLTFIVLFIFKFGQIWQINKNKQHTEEWETQTTRRSFYREYGRFKMQNQTQKYSQIKQTLLHGLTVHVSTSCVLAGLCCPLLDNTETHVFVWFVP